MTPQEAASIKKTRRKTRSKTLTGYGLLIQTSDQAAGILLCWESTFDNNPVAEHPDIHEIYALLIIVQKAFPELFIISN